jgi:hypothetical protein
VDELSRQELELECSSFGVWPKPGHSIDHLDLVLFAYTWSRKVSVAKGSTESGFCAPGGPTPFICFFPEKLYSYFLTNLSKKTHAYIN